MKTETKKNLLFGVFASLAVCGSVIWWTWGMANLNERKVDAGGLSGEGWTDAEVMRTSDSRWRESDEVVQRGLMQLMKRHGMTELCVLPECEADWIEMEGGSWKPGICLFPVEFAHMERFFLSSGAVMITLPMGDSYSNRESWTREIEVEWWPEESKADGHGLSWTVMGKD